MPLGPWAHTGGARTGEGEGGCPRRLPAPLPVRPCVRPSFYLVYCPSVCLCVRLSVGLWVCESVDLSPSPSLSLPLPLSLTHTHLGVVAHFLGDPAVPRVFAALGTQTEDVCVDSRLHGAVVVHEGNKLVFARRRPSLVVEMIFVRAWDDLFFRILARVACQAGRGCRGVVRRMRSPGTDLAGRGQAEKCGGGCGAG